MRLTFNGWRLICKPFIKSSEIVGLVGLPTFRHIKGAKLRLTI